MISGAQAQSSWLLGGNAGTNPLTDFLGTTDSVSLSLRVTDSVSLSLRVNNQRALLLQPTA
jgi:hypothetical protein